MLSKYRQLTKSFAAPLVLGVIWLVLVNVLALYALNQAGGMQRPPVTFLETQKQLHEAAQQPSWNPLLLHFRWDAVWYTDLAERRYFYSPEQKLSNIVFFPLYPMLIRAVMPVFGSALLAGWILSILFLLAALVLLFRYVQVFHKNIRPFEVVFFLLIFPSAFFLNAVYTESLFVLLSVSVFYLARRERFAAAGVVGALAALSRPQGVLLFFPLAWEYFQHFGKVGWRRAEVVALALPVLAAAGFFGFHYWKFGDVLAFFDVQQWFGRVSVFSEAGRAIPFFYTDLGLLMFLLAVMIMWKVFQKFRLSYGVYIAASLLMPLSSLNFMSLSRFLLVLFPIYFVIATLKNRVTKYVWAMVSIALMITQISMYALGFWSG